MTNETNLTPSQLAAARARLARNYCVALPPDTAEQIQGDIRDIITALDLARARADRAEAALASWANAWSAEIEEDGKWKWRGPGHLFMRAMSATQDAIAAASLANRAGETKETDHA